MSQDPAMKALPPVNSQLGVLGQAMCDLISQCSHLYSGCDHVLGFTGGEPFLWDFAEWADRLESQRRAGIAVLTPKPAWKQSSFSFGDPQSFSLEASMDEAHPRYGGSSALLRVYGQNVNHI